jgi:hypothetical protein
MRELAMTHADARRESSLELSWAATAFSARSSPICPHTGALSRSWLSVKLPCDLQRRASLSYLTARRRAQRLGGRHAPRRGVTDVPRPAHRPCSQRCWRGLVPGTPSQAHALGAGIGRISREGSQLVYLEQADDLGCDCGAAVQACTARLIYGLVLSWAPCSPARAAFPQRLLTPQSAPRGGAGGSAWRRPSSTTRRRRSRRAGP